VVIWDVQVIFEGDALTIVNAICQDVPCWRSYGQLIEDTCTLYLTPKLLSRRPVLEKLWPAD
jgi:hypothetical protein